MSSVLSTNRALIVLPLALVKSRYSGLSVFLGINCPKENPINNKDVAINAAMLVRIRFIVFNFRGGRYILCKNIWCSIDSD